MPEEEATAALALNAASFNIGRALAPVVGVGIITTVGYAWAFAFNALSFVVLMAVLLRLRPRPTIRDTGSPKFIYGLRIVAHERRFLVPLVMIAFATAATDPPLVLGPELARDFFHVPETWSACFVAALGSGTVLGSLLRPRHPSLRFAAAWLDLLGGVAMAFAIIPVYWAATAAIALAGVASLMVVTSTQTLMLALAGPHRAGRVMAVWSMSFAGSRSIATAVDTWVADHLGPRTSSILLALPAIAIAAASGISHSRGRSSK